MTRILLAVMCVVVVSGSVWGKVSAEKAAGTALRAALMAASKPEMTPYEREMVRLGDANIAESRQDRCCRALYQIGLLLVGGIGFWVTYKRMRASEKIARAAIRNAKAVKNSAMTARSATLIERQDRRVEVYRSDFLSSDKPLSARLSAVAGLRRLAEETDPFAENSYPYREEVVVLLVESITIESDQTMLDAIRENLVLIGPHALEILVKRHRARWPAETLTRQVGSGPIGRPEWYPDDFDPSVGKSKIDQNLLPEDFRASRDTIARILYDLSRRCETHTHSKPDHGIDIMPCGEKGSPCLQWLGPDHLDGIALTGADLRFVCLSKLGLKRARLDAADLSAADLRKVDFSESDLTGTYMMGAKMQKVVLSHVLLKKALFDRARLEEATIDNADARGAVFEASHLKGTKFLYTHLAGAALYKAYDLENAEFVASNWWNTLESIPKKYFKSEFSLDWHRDTFQSSWQDDDKRKDDTT
jgi:hypothetical protein